MRKKGAAAGALCLAAMIAFSGCANIANTSDAADYSGEPKVSSEEGVEAQMQQNSYYADFDSEPYVVRTILKEYADVDPDTGTGFYGRYTQLQAEGKAPDTFLDALAECNRRAEEAVRARAEQIKEENTASGAEASEYFEEDGYQYVTYGYIAAVARADQTAFSILETEFERGIGKADSEITYQFRGLTCDTQSGEEIALADLMGGDEDACSEQLQEALQAKYGVTGLASAEPGDYALIADVLGVRFYFDSDAVSKDRRREINDYSARAVHVSFPYAVLPGEKAGALAAAPESYIAMIDRETVYDLPHGDLSIQLTQKEDELYIRFLPDKGEEDERSIEYADDLSDFYIIRAEGGFYLFRERIGYQEGFFYDFARRDGGFGRFAYNTSQYFDSFMREMQAAIPYNPYCVHMAEVRRSVGESAYGKGSFIPTGHYSFPSNPDARYKIFVLRDESLQIDAGNQACRLLEDFAATQIDEEGNEIGEITVPAGRTLILESVAGEASRYALPPQRSSVFPAFYYCRLTDGTRIRFESDTYNTVSVGGAYMNRISEPVTLGEAQFEETPEPAEVFTVHIAGKDYPTIPDYSLKDHAGEEIDFGDDIWWLVEEYPGRYVCTEEDLKDLAETFFVDSAIYDSEEKPELEISEDGRVVFHYLGREFRGELPEKRFYRRDAAVYMESETERRSFRIILRDREDHEAPSRIEFYSEGEPATNEPSKVPPILVYLTKE